MFVCAWGCGCGIASAPGLDGYVQAVVKGALAWVAVVTTIAHLCALLAAVGAQ